MFLNKESIFVTIICAAGLGIFVALWLLDFAVVRIDACEAHESRGLCLRGWISALSGWAAAIGALIAAGLTIAKLREQIAEQKRQTNFIVGDAAPDFIIERNRETKICTLKIINWNRHRIIIEKIIMNNHCYNIDCFSYNESDQYVACKNFKVNGWLNRDKQPPQRDIDVIIMPKQGFPQFPFDQIIELSIDYRIVSQNQARGLAKAQAIEII